MKLETWLRITGVPYEVAPLDIANAPKGKVPYIVEQDGTRIGDSTLIVSHLKAARGKDPDAALSAEQRAVATSFRRMLKEHFYWVIIHERYKDERNWSHYRELIIGMLDFLPAEHRPPATDQYRQMFLAQLQAQGMGRHSADEVHRLGQEDLTAVSDYLGSRPFFLGEQPTTVDATVYAYVGNMLGMGLSSPVKDFGRSRENLVSYCQRMHQRFFPELSATWR
jgi:glutathione S-transferase